ncbi:hypothetical protein BANRA_05578 [Klebsiella pneumoniae]|nr:hypothetical protein BANRA_05578 [Klebsiella pneumoniae]
MQTVIMGIMIGMFPIMVMAAMFNMMTLQVLKGMCLRLSGCRRGHYCSPS